MPTPLGFSFREGVVFQLKTTQKGAWLEQAGQTGALLR